MSGLGWSTPRILAHLDDAPDFYLDQVARVMDRWSSGRVGQLGDAAFSSAPFSGGDTGMALVGACVLAGELATAGWDPQAGFAGYERRMRQFVEANHEIGRLHGHSRAVPGPDAAPAPEPDMEALMAVVHRAINGVDLPTTRKSRTSEPAPDRRTSHRPSRSESRDGCLLQCEDPFSQRERRDPRQPR